MLATSGMVVSDEPKNNIELGIVIVVSSLYIFYLADYFLVTPIRKKLKHSI